MVRQRFKTGWVALAPTARWPEPAVHRPDPDRAGHVMCGRKIGEHPVEAARPAGVRECCPCTMRIARARKRALAALHRSAQARQRIRLDPDEVDRHDRERERGSSVRAASAGLPGLGRRS